MGACCLPTFKLQRCQNKWKSKWRAIRHQKRKSHWTVPVTFPCISHYHAHHFSFRDLTSILSPRCPGFGSRAGGYCVSSSFQSCIVKSQTMKTKSKQHSTNKPHRNNTLNNESTTSLCLPRSPTSPRIYIFRHIHILFLVLLFPN